MSLIISIAYWLIVLVAMDKFIENLVKDDIRIRKYINEDE